MKTVAALCVHPRSVYKKLPGVECWDIRRDVRTFAGQFPIVAHPPCRTWSAFCKHQAKAPVGEKELGLLCAGWLRKCGGVLEHPAFSGLFEAAGLPLPGNSAGGLWTCEVWQVWWGTETIKRTWLCFSGTQEPSPPAGRGFHSGRRTVALPSLRAALHPDGGTQAAQADAVRGLSAAGHLARQATGLELHPGDGHKRPAKRPWGIQFGRVGSYDTGKLVPAQWSFAWRECCRQVGLRMELDGKEPWLPHRLDPRPGVQSHVAGPRWAYWWKEKINITVFMLPEHRGEHVRSAVLEHNREVLTRCHVRGMKPTPIWKTYPSEWTGPALPRDEGQDDLTESEWQALGWSRSKWRDFQAAVSDILEQDEQRGVRLPSKQHFALADQKNEQ